MNRSERNDKILVIGATGTIGSEVVKLLASYNNNAIRAAVHSQNKADKFKQYSTVESVNFDYNKPDTIANALTDINKVFLLTALDPNMEDIYFNVIQQAKKNGVAHIMKLSAEGADAEPGTIIGKIHRREEKIIEESGIPYTFLRPTGFMQNFVNFFGHTIKTQNAFYLPAGDGKANFVDARDIAAVAVKILQTKSDKKQQQYENKAYHITGQEALSHNQAAETLSKVIGRKISYIDITEDDARKAMKEMGMENWFIDALIEVYKIARLNLAPQHTNVVEQITGRKPIYFEQFVKDYVEFFR
jgi:uncharacterized protein YbjT (DUF2867 family)